MASVGYDLYVQMVNDAISELNGGRPDEPEHSDITVEIPVAAHLPADYVERDDLRLDAYRRLASVRSAAEVDDIEAGWVDRFGPVPEPATNLLAVARVRAECVRCGVSSVVVSKVGALSGGGLVARISPVRLTQSKQMRLERVYRGSHYKETLNELQLRLERATSPAEQITDALRQLVPEPVGAT